MLRLIALAGDNPGTKTLGTSDRTRRSSLRFRVCATPCRLAKRCQSRETAVEKFRVGQRSICLGGRSIATTARSWLFSLVLLLTGASVFIFGGACAIVFSADRDCSAAGYYGCEAYSLAGMVVLALGGVLLILIAAVAISFLCYRDWNSVE